MATNRTTLNQILRIRGGVITSLPIARVGVVSLLRILGRLQRRTPSDTLTEQQLANGTMTELASGTIAQLLHGAGATVEAVLDQAGREDPVGRDINRVFADSGLTTSE